MRVMCSTTKYNIPFPSLCLIECGERSSLSTKTFTHSDISSAVVVGVVLYTCEVNTFPQVVIVNKIYAHYYLSKCTHTLPYTH